MCFLARCPSPSTSSPPSVLPPLPLPKLYCPLLQLFSSRHVHLTSASLLCVRSSSPVRLHRRCLHPSWRAWFPRASLSTPFTAFPPMHSGCLRRKVAGGGFFGAAQVNQGYIQAMKQQRSRKRENGATCSKEEWLQGCPACRTIARRESDLRAAQQAGIVRTDEEARAFRQKYHVGKAHRFGWVDPADPSSTPQACPGKINRDLSSTPPQQPSPPPPGNIFSHHQQTEPPQQQLLQQQEPCCAQYAQQTTRQESEAMLLQV